MATESMNEKRNYTDRTMTHFVWDPQRAEWTNMLVFMIFDQRTATSLAGVSAIPGAGNADALNYYSSNLG